MSNPSILQWNCNGFYSKINEIKLLIQDKNPFILCIQESHIKPPTIPNLKNFTTNHKEPNLMPNDRVRGGVIIFVNNDYSSSEINIDSSLQVVATRIHYPISMTVWKGRLIEKIADDLMLSIMNVEKCNSTHIKIHNGSFSAIDLSICSPIIEGYFEWDTIEDSHCKRPLPNNPNSPQQQQHKTKKTALENKQSKLGKI